MLIFFVRHGETVDNVGGIYAGVRDSELTNHGILQARSLADYLRQSRCPVGLILASPLQRARRTAEAILDAQNGKTGTQTSAGDADPGRSQATIVKTPLLIEQDFGFYEGKPFYARSSESNKSGKDAHYDKHRQDPNFKDVESKESMAKRCDEFLDEFLVPAIHERDGQDIAIAVVSHGILLSNLWRRFLLRLARKSITIAPEVTAAKGQIILEHLGGWSNTGFLEVRLTSRSDPDAGLVNDLQLLSNGQGTVPASDALPSSTTNEAASTEVDGDTTTPPVPISTGEVADPDTPSVLFNVPPRSRGLASYDVNILTVNGQEHLRGVKRARGGIGSSKYDEGQKSLDSFFKKAKK
ncbi:histidine phosphatase superfamily [Elsinoe ampelina]|uniref:Histidine phosphatase superfamily n=1 Tax=Elsinoe ampelina TaxID=302913 RepID=A0A6A6G200_9PEZI|nr:histidine phosphatase superfamily [Elsinoe ampelina]